MTVLAFDGRMGASGDMLLGALLDAGADSGRLEPVAAALDLEYRVDTTERCGIAATAVSVVPSDDGPDHRHYTEVVEIIERLELSKAVETDALAIVEFLGRAEAAVHDTDLESTHFHEVGADDAIADIVGTCLLVDDFDPDAIVTTPLATGGGTVEMSHGTYPVPAPAVLEIAARADWSIRGGPVDAELLTPTGAAILCHLADGIDALPPMAVTESGYGAGRAEHDPHPNVLRAISGREHAALSREPISVLETSVDDATPEVIGSLQETLLAAGALDVTVVPATMKKSRPGVVISVICRREDAERLAARLARETGSLGVREADTRHRFVASRRMESVSVQVGDSTHEVRVKVASDDEGDVFDVSAEYDDALAVARAADVPVREVLARAERAWAERF